MYNLQSDTFAPVIAIPNTEFNELFAAVQNDDTIAFKQLYQKYWKALYISACKRIDDDAAQDMVQEVMVTLWKRRNAITIESADDLERYLHTALKYRIVSYFAYDAQVTSIPEWFDITFDPHIESAYDARQLQEVINSEVNLMPQRMQLIFNLSRQYDLSIADIASQLNLSEQTVKNQLTMAMKRLRVSLSRYLQNDLAICSAIAYLLFGVNN
ncbi:sigma-70 family RNA polymerase sigma factor [Mucilaginibacter sp. JRF]|uniref:sigma-70 family RNA polymerase sigma factor n=1 Tax=Mucilaginibacter sp. JRF TaxID=2780088 RepID=UPI003221BD23